MRRTWWIGVAARWGGVLSIAAGLGCGGSSDAPAASKGCGRDADCAAGQVCDADLGQCKAGAAGKGGAAGAAGVVQNDSVPADAPCTVLPQSGCPTGHACLVSNPAGTTSCYTAGVSTLGERCSGLNDCVAGLVCAYGQCRPICAALSDCASRPYGECYPYKVGADQTPLPHFGFCSLQCNPTDPGNKAKKPEFAACLPGSTCSFSADTPSGSTECFQAGTKGPGAACDQPGDCAPGQTCLLTQAGSSTGECTPLCLVSEGGCQQGSCQSFAQKHFVGTKGGLLEVGACY